MALYRDDRRALLDHKLTELLLYAKELCPDGRVEVSTLQEVGQREQPQAELSVAIDLYRAMEMTFWLPQAEAVLARAGEAGGATRDGLSIP